MRCYIAIQQLFCAFSQRGCPFDIGCQEFNNTKSFIHIITGKSDGKYVSVLATFCTSVL